ncbi:MAG: serine protease, partial [Candidatus Liptonbacteria bacterium]|nr:serine protease [Candidatus Liptonbacteria bacterium]
VIKDGKKFKAKVVDFDSVKDLALLKVADDETNFSGTSFVFCNKPEFADGKGKPWIGFGFIQPKILLFTEFRYFEGYVESAMPAGEKQLRGFLEQSIQPGFSGGPVLDKNGYCLGILHGTYPIVSVFSPTSEIIVFLDKNKVKYHMK